MFVRKYIAEMMGTFMLSLMVLLAINTAEPFVAVPVVAGLTLMMSIYAIGNVSGCHINPAITIGLLAIRKIGFVDFLLYWFFQFVGALLAMTLYSFIKPSEVTPEVAEAIEEVGSIIPADTSVLVAEILGTAVFGWVIASLAKKHTPAPVAGIVGGTGLFLGIMTAVSIGSAGVLNPAVALATGNFEVAYIVAPMLGAVLGMGLYTLLISRGDHEE